MSAVRKYADLPDVDLAPDVYETPELTDDTSTHITSTTLRSDSPQSEESDENIDRHRINPDEARTQFLSPEDQDPSLFTRISSKRRSYRSSSRRSRRQGNDLGDEQTSSGEDEESLDRRLARLRREVAEVKGEIFRQKAEDEANGKSKQNDTLSPELEEIEALSEVLESARPESSIGRQANGAAGRLSARLLVPTSKPNQPESEIPDAPPPNAPFVTQSATYNPTHTLSKISAFDQRLTLLESALGIDALPLSSSTSSSQPPKPLLPTLDILDQQITSLTTSTDTSLESMSRRIRQLTDESRRLEESRKAAKAAREALVEHEQQQQQGQQGQNVNRDSAATTTNGQKASSSQTHPNGTPDPSFLSPPSQPSNSALDLPQDPDHISLLHALHALLPTLTSLSPLLPSTLDRLRSLRALHADASQASFRLQEVESAQAKNKEEIKMWREGLDMVERKLGEGELRMRDNSGVVEAWVRDLEGRVKESGLR